MDSAATAQKTTAAKTRQIAGGNSGLLNIFTLAMRYWRRRRFVPPEPVPGLLGG
jgi:hypothetical protein